MFGLKKILQLELNLYVNKVILCTFPKIIGNRERDVNGGVIVVELWQPIRFGTPSKFVTSNALKTNKKKIKICILGARSRRLFAFRRFYDESMLKSKLRSAF